MLFFVSWKGKQMVTMQQAFVNGTKEDMSLQLEPLSAPGWGENKAGQ